MDVYTIQLARHRLAKERGIPLVDTTVKSGIRAFAPSWPMVVGYKAGSISEEEYTERFFQKIKEEEWATHDDWKWLLSHEKVALACYCKAHHFCHRYLLVEHLRAIREKQNLPFNYCGEIMPEEGK